MRHLEENMTKRVRGVKLSSYTDLSLDGERLGASQIPSRYGQLYSLLPEGTSTSVPVAETAAFPDASQDCIDKLLSGFQSNVLLFSAPITNKVSIPNEAERTWHVHATHASAKGVHADQAPTFTDDLGKFAHAST